jgi:very-short-patch-repair endonuclease
MSDEPTLWLPRGAVASHTSAARLWGLPLPVGHDELQHLTLPRNRSRWHPTDAVVHRRNLELGEITQVDGRPVTSPLRTLLDLPTVLSLGGSVAAADAALRLGLLSRADLVRVSGLAMGRGARAVRAMGRLADPSADSPLESEVRVLLVLADLAPRTQFVVRDENGTFVIRLDFAWPDDLVGLLADGFEYHSERDAYRKDRKQDNELKRLGWYVPRVAWEHVFGEPDYVVDLVGAILRRRRRRRHAA